MRRHPGFAWLLCLVLLGLAPAPAAAADSTAPAGPAQDVTLEAVGLGGQTVYGLSPTLSVYFPRPAATLAASGSRIHLVYAHSPLLLPDSSTMTLLVNGTPITAVRLSADTAAGSVLDVAVPAGLLQSGQTNQLEARFFLRISRNVCDDPNNRAVFARLDGASSMHYQLSGGPGLLPPARLETYPFPLSEPSGGASPRLVVATPDQPSPAELAAAYRVLGDFTQRTGTEMSPRVIDQGQQAWYEQGPDPGFVVARLDRLPIARAAALAAGFKESGGGLHAPDGSAVGSEDGILIEVRAGAGAHAPRLVITSATDSGLEKAAAALIGPTGLALAGSFAVVRSVHSTPLGQKLAPAGKAITVADLGRADIRAAGGGQHAFSVGFLAPNLDRSDFGYVNLVISHSSILSAGNSAVTARINDTDVGTVVTDRTNEQASRIQFRFPGQLLNPGLNSLGLNLSVASANGCDANQKTGGGGSDADQWINISSGSTIQLPRSAPVGVGGIGGRVSLRALPYPFLDATDGSTTRIILADASESTLSAAGQAVVSLAGRAVSGMPALEVAFAQGMGDPTAGARNLIVVGVPGGRGHLEPLGSALKLQVSGSRVGVSDLGLHLSGQVSPEGPLGALELLKEPGNPNRVVLWINGTDEATLRLAAAALSQRSLAGTVVSVDSKGRTRALAELNSATLAIDALEIRIVKGLLALAVLGLVLLLGWQLWRPREAAP